MEFYPHAPIDLQVISIQTQAKCARTGASMPAWLSYRSDAPLQIEASFLTANGPVPWVFGRELLAEALANGHAGAGDVRLETAEFVGSLPAQMVVHLRSHDGSARLLLDQQALREFLRASEQIVPLRQERLLLDLDAELRELLG